jgi:hypothetical protein
VKVPRMVGAGRRWSVMPSPIPRSAFPRHQARSGSLCAYCVPLHCHIAHHTTNNNVEVEGGGGLMLVIEVEP